MISQKMISNVYMFGSRILNEILVKVYSTCIITFDWNVIKFNAIVYQLFFCHKTCEQHKLATIYSASAVAKAIETYFLLNQETKHYPKS